MPLYEEIEIEDMTYDKINLLYWYPCPCGDKFKIYLEDLYDGEDIADCQSCTLFIQVIYEEENLPPLPPEENDEENDDQDQDGKDEKEEETGKEEEEKDDSIAMNGKDNTTVDDDDQKLVDKVSAISI